MSGKTQRRLVGLYVGEASGPKGMSWAELVYEEEHESGTRRLVRTRPAYHQDGGPEWHFLFPVLVALWRPVVLMLRKMEEGRESRGKRGRA